MTAHSWPPSPSLRVKRHLTLHMKNWKSKLFGDNRMNFYCWVFAWLLVVGTSLWLVLKAIRAGATESPVCLLLIAIYLLLVTHLSLAIQNYCARVARHLETEDAKKEPRKDETMVV
jgi:cobalamin biosynthesis protein CobD/CbiB